MNQSWWRFPIFLRGRIRTKCSQLPPNSGETKRSVNNTVDFILFYHLNLIKRNANLSDNAQDWAGLFFKKNANLSWFEWNFFEMLFISSGFLEKRNFMFQFCCKKKWRGGNSCPYLKRQLPHPPTALVGGGCCFLSGVCFLGQQLQHLLHLLICIGSGYSTTFRGCAQLWIFLKFHQIFSNDGKVFFKILFKFSSFFVRILISFPCPSFAYHDNLHINFFLKDQMNERLNGKGQSCSPFWLAFGISVTTTSGAHSTAAALQRPLSGPRTLCLRQHFFFVWKCPLHLHIFFWECGLFSPERC